MYICTCVWRLEVHLKYMYALEFGGYRSMSRVFLIVPHLYFSKSHLFVCYACECLACQECWIALNVATYRLL